MRTRWSMLALALAAAPLTAAAQDKDTLYLRTLAATCANCHGTDGRAVPGSAIAGLAGMPRDAMVASLMAFKAGTRPATVMHQIAKGYTDAQIQQIAGYFAAQKQ